MIRLTREQFETLKRRENPEVFTSEQISNWIIDYSEMLQKAELNELDEVEKAAVDQFNDEFKSFTKVTVVDSPVEDSLQKGLVYTDYYIREQQIKWDDDVITKSEDGNETIEKAKSGVYTDTAHNRKMGRVGQRYGDKTEETEYIITTTMRAISKQQIEAIEKLGGTIHEDYITFNVENQEWGEHCEDEQKIWNEIQKILPGIDGALQGHPLDESDLNYIYFKINRKENIK